MGVLAHLVGVFALHHDPAEGFCPRIAQEHAPPTVQFRFQLCHGFPDGGALLKGQALFHMHIDKALRKGREQPGKF